MTIEERVAQLEQQLSEMSVQVLSTDTEPEGYQTSKYSVEESDALLAAMAAQQWPDAPPWPSTSEGGGVPAGTICMYAGSTAPDGWAFCDGSNGTPDLRGFFIVGANKSGADGAPIETGRDYPLGSSGGARKHTLKASQMPKHSHVQQMEYGGDIYQMVGVGSMSGTRIMADPGTFSTYSGNGPVNTLSAGGGNAFEILPPYYALAYILKL